MVAKWTQRRRAGRSEAAKGMKAAGRTGATIFFLFFLAMGTAFLVFLAVAFFRSLSTYAWDAVPATIASSEIVRDREGNHRFCIGYEYTVNGRAYASENYDDPSRPGYSSDDYASLQRLVVHYPAGAACTAYVDPSDPSRAILSHPSLWIGLFVFVPLLFVMIGAGGIYFTWFGKSGMASSIAGRARSKQFSGKWIVRVMGVVFLAVGLVCSYFIVVLPVRRVQRAKSWTPIPATVIDSRVVSHRGDDSTTYSIDILYEYEVDGRTLRSNRYHFVTGSSSGYGAKQAIVDAHPPGKNITVYVNPADPFEAVADRDYPMDLWFGLIPLVFSVAGLAMFAGSFFVRGKRSRGPRPAWLPDAEDATADDLFSQYGSPQRRVTLRRTSSPLGKLIGVGFAAVFWNGITGVFVGMAIRSHLAGNPEWFLTLFIIPFVLIGIALICAVPYQFLALFNPAPILEVGTATPSLGDTLAIDWRLAGRTERISSLRLSLVGEERATYRRGTDTVTDSHTFYDETLLETSNRNDILHGGHIDVLIPRHVMHSFESDHNKITWTLQIAGKIKYWPDVKDAFRLVIQPMRPEAMFDG